MALVPTTVSNNILQRAFRENVPVTPMKLQKLLYFVSCEYVKATDCDLLSEDFCVWQYGPVLPSVYNEFKSFRGNRITEYAKDADGNSFAYNEATSPNLRASIDRIWMFFKSKSGVELSLITHEDGSGWSRAFEQRHSKITKEEMKADDSYRKYMFA